MTSPDKRKNVKPKGAKQCAKNLCGLCAGIAHVVKITAIPAKKRDDLLCSDAPLSDMFFDLLSCNCVTYRGVFSR